MNPLTVISNDDILSIHQASLATLRDVGVQVPHQQVLQALADAGANVDFARQVARMPENMIAEALQKCGKKYIVYGRDRNQQARFGYGDFVLVSTAGQYSWVDRDGGSSRPVRISMSPASPSPKLEAPIPAWPRSSTDPRTSSTWIEPGLSRA